MEDGLTIVISPLIALMKDQVKNRDDDCLDGDWLYTKKSKDRDWLYFNSDLSLNDRREVIRRIKEGRVRLLYTSPEQFKSSAFSKLLASAKRRVRRIVIDEAHCVIEWGYSFRVKYLHIAQAIKALEGQPGRKIPVLLLTATATPSLQRQIAEKLQVQIPTQNYITQRSGADRLELQVRLQEVRDDDEKFGWLAKQVKEGGSLYKRPDGKRKRGIIFSAFADGGEGLGAHNAEKICDKLTERGVKRIGYYHGKMDLDKRRDIQNKFQSGQLSVLVATKAFGMGIDLPKLDFIIHFYPPLSLEEYWQEAGRGGRGMNAENEHCDCIVLYHPSDRRLLQGFPNVASFEKILCTFTSAADEELCFDVEKVRRRGELCKLLNHLSKLKDIRPLKRRLQVGNVELARWKLLKPAGEILQHIKEAQKSGVCKKTKQAKRLYSNLRIRTERTESAIRVECGTRDTGHKLEYYALELNWLTEPEIAALEMLDDEITDGKRYSRFKILKSKLSRQDVETLADKINSYRSEGYEKLDHVFDTFLKSEPDQAKSSILEHLGIQEPVFDFITEIRNRDFHAWAFLDNGKELGVMPSGNQYFIVTPEGWGVRITETLEQALHEIATIAADPSSIEFDE